MKLDAKQRWVAYTLKTVGSIHSENCGQHTLSKLWVVTFVAAHITVNGASKDIRINGVVSLGLLQRHRRSGSRTPCYPCCCCSFSKIAVD